MRFTVLCSTFLLVGLWMTACGGARNGERGHAQAAASGEKRREPVWGSARYRNDGDAENAHDRDTDDSLPSHEDGDGDSVEEYEEANSNGLYHDSDDAAMLGYGRPASAGERREVSATVARYHSAAAAGDAEAACSMLATYVARSLVEDEGRGAGPAYLRGARTCRAVMSRIFKHHRARLGSPIAVTGVRTQGDRALAFTGSRAMPASYFTASKERGEWKIVSPLGTALP